MLNISMKHISAFGFFELIQKEFCLKLFFLNCAESLIFCFADIVGKCQYTCMPQLLNQMITPINIFMYVLYIYIYMYVDAM